MRGRKAKAVKLRESRHVKVARIIYTQTQAVFPKLLQPKEVHLAAVGGVCAAVFLLQDELPRLRGAAADEQGAAGRAGS